MEYKYIEGFGSVVVREVSMEVLKENMKVLFYSDPYGIGRLPYNGTILYKTPRKNTVCVCYLHGHSSLTDDIPIADVITYQPLGE